MHHGLIALKFWEESYLGSVLDSCWFVLTRVDLCWYSCIRIDLIVFIYKLFDGEYIDNKMGENRGKIVFVVLRTKRKLQNWFTIQFFEIDFEK